MIREGKEKVEGEGSAFLEEGGKEQQGEGVREKSRERVGPGYKFPRNRRKTGE